MNKCKLEFVREDDFVEYFIFPTLSNELKQASSSSSKGDAESGTATPQLLECMNGIQMKCIDYINELVKERAYIWHKDTFQLQIRTGCKQERLLYDEYDENVEKHQQEILPPHLHGVTHYGDNIADEWFIVFLLKKLTLKFNDCIARIIDTDGEFLLIEAADALPKWANPETCEQRVYLKQGLLHLVENSPGVHNKNLITVNEALTKLRVDPELFQANSAIQRCIEERTKEFTSAEQVAQQQHHQIARLPLGVVALLRERPDLIAPAVRAFCERDSQDNKVLRSMRYFPPEVRMRERVRFTRCLYAMMMHTQFVPDRRTGWQLGNASKTEQYKEDLLGIKIACGFELLATKAKESDNSPAWRTYLRGLQTRGYFRNELEGSKLYQQLLEEARDYFNSNNQSFRTSPVVGREILDLLDKLNLEQLNTEDDKNLKPSDSDNWLNISEADLDNLLMERYGAQKLFNTNGDMNAAEFTKNLQDFLEKQSGFDGINLDSDDDDIEADDDDNAEDADADDDSDNAIHVEPSHSKSKSKNKAMERKAFKNKVKKNSSMRRACTQNPVIVEQKNKKANDATTTESTQVRNVLEFNVPEDDWESNSDMDDYENEDELELNFDDMANPEMSVDQIKEYMAQMDRELAKTTIGQSFEKEKKTIKKINRKLNDKESSDSDQNDQNDDDDDDFDDIESFEPININVNTLKNMIDSFKYQAGGPGPVSNLFSAMGVGMSNASGSSAKDSKKKPDITESRV